MSLLSDWNRRRLDRRRAAQFAAVRDDPSLRLDMAALRRARVVVIGPADTAADELGALDPDGHDLVVRINNGLAMAQAAQGALGRRTDMLVHNLKESGARSAGRLDPEIMRAQGLSTVLFPHAGPGRITSDLPRARRRLDSLGIALRMPDPDLYAQWCAALAPAFPTSGAVAILTMLAARPAGLSLAGFTFFRTGYAPGYNAAGAGAQGARDWVARTGVHDPEAERQLVTRELDLARAEGVEIALGEGVAAALEA